MKKNVLASSIAQIAISQILIFALMLTALGQSVRVSGGMPVIQAPADTGTGSVSLTTLDAAIPTETFDTLSNTAGSTTNTTLPTGWYLTETGGGARDNEQYAVDTGSSTTGDIYSYGAAAATDRAFGELRSGTLIPLYGAKFTNNTGSTITSLDVSYTGEQWRFGGAHSPTPDRLDFQYSLNATDLSTGTYVDADALDFNPPVTAGSAGPLDGNAAANRTAISSTISTLSIPSGASFFIRFNDADATGADDGLSVDNFSLTPHGAAGGQPNLTINDVTLAEGNAGTTNFTYTVSLSAPAGPGGVTFDIATADGTAQDGTPVGDDNDYVANSLSAQTITQGNSSYSFTVLVNGDTAAETNETFFVNVTNATGATVTDGQGQGTITNDDAVPPNLSINDVTLSEGNAGTTNFTFTVGLSAVAGPGGVTFDIATADGTAQDDNPVSEDNDYVAKTLTAQTIAAGNNSYSFTVVVNGDTAGEANETFFVNITNVSGAVVTDGQGLGTINNDDLTKIHDIQGNGTTSPFATQSVSTSGIVTAIKSGSSGGFFIQEPVAGYDADPNTSEGIFVFTGSSVPAAAVVGNNVQVTGTVQEFIPSADPNQKPMTELGGTIVAALLSSGNPLPAATTITGPDTQAPGLENLERYEGMRVTVPSMTVIAPTQGTITESSATVSSNGVFYGVVTGVPRPFREPGVNVSDPLPPGSPAGVPRFDENPERLRVDSDAQPGTTLVDVNAGTVLSNVTGPMEYAFRTWTILPDATIVPGAQPGSSAVPTPLASELTIASFNMERFFDTTNDPSTSDPVLTVTAFNNRLAKASRIIRTVQKYPDVIGVEEMENLATLQAVAAKVNGDAVGIDALPNPNYVAYLIEGNDIGGIDVGFLVKSSRVTVVDVTQVELPGCDHVTPSTCNSYTNPNDGTLDILNDRPPLVLRATIPDTTANPFPFTVIVNHMRSLSGIDDATVSGSGTTGLRVRTKRQKGAEFLANYIQSRQIANPTERIITLGDLNAFQVSDGYADVIGTIKGTPSPDNQTVVAGDGADLVNPDLTDLVETAIVPAAQKYSYSFDGNAQVLDHILVNDDAKLVVNWFQHARDDADFAVKNYENANELRLSDHDQPIVYLSLVPKSPTAAQASISGRVLTPDGRGLRGAEVFVTDAAGKTHSVRTGALGYFTFDDLEVGQSYIIGVNSARYNFTSRLVTLNDALTEFDMIAEE